MSIDRWKPKTFPFVCGVASSERIASLAPVRMPLPKRSIVRAKNIQSGNVKIAIIGFEIVLKAYPI